MFEIILFSFLIMLASLSGVLFVWKTLGNFINKNLRYLVSFSAGVFLFITYLLIVEMFHLSNDIYLSLIWVFTGVLLIAIIFKLLPSFHHHHDEKEEGHSHNKLDARKILISDGIHNIGDGILLTTSTIVSPMIGLVTAISIFIHEFVQEVSEFFVLRQAGYSIKKALKLNFLVSGTILIGAIGSYFLFETFEILEIPLLGIAAGSFIVVVINDLIPHSIRNSKNKTNLNFHLLAFILGILIMIFINSFLDHTHEHNNNYPDEHQNEHTEYIH